MYSQNNEEQYILEYFKTWKGNFLEIGSFDPFKFSNTRALVELGWRGVYCEPSPSCFQSFINEYRDNNKILLLNYAIGAENGTMKFYDSKGDAISTSIVTECVKWGVDRFKEITVDVMSMNDLIDKYAKNIDFLNIDVEGNSYELFKLIPDSFFGQLKMICIEHDNKKEEIEEHLHKFGFTTVLHNFENLIMQK
jgi:FkbM family methyltransferase